MKNSLKAKFILLLLIITSLYIYGINSIPFLNRTDSRYAEIAREMLQSGHFMVPRLMGTVHLHKPPLSYWIIAIGMKIFGQNEMGARFFLAVFAILCLLLVYVIAGLFFNEEVAIWSFVLFGLSPAMFFTSKILSTDIFLLFFELCGMFFYLKFMEGKAKRYVIGFSIVMGLAFLTKGPVGVFIPLLVLVAFSLFKKDFSFIKAFFTLTSFSLFLLVGFWWYFYILLLKPEVFKYFVVDQLMARITGIKGIRMGHPKPFYYYFEILPVLILPYYLPFVIFVIKKFKEGFSEKETLLTMWFSVPLLFFSVILTKLPTYVIFSVPPAAILTAHFVVNSKMKFKFLFLTAGLLPLVFLIKSNVFVLPLQTEFYLFRLVIISLVIILFLLLTELISPRFYIYPFSIGWAFVLFFIVDMLIVNPRILKANRDVLREVKSIAKSDFIVVCFREYSFQIPFYIGEMPYFCDLKLEKGITPFSRNLDCKKFLSLWRKNRVLAIVSEKNLIDFTNMVKDLFVIALDGSVYVVSNKPITGIKIRWKDRASLHNIRPLKGVLKFITVPIGCAKTKVLKIIPHQFKIHDEELCILNRRLYYEFEFLDGNRICEYLVDTMNGSVFKESEVKGVPEIDQATMNTILKADEKSAREKALKIVDGEVVEKEIEIENGVLCYSYGIFRNGNEYEVLIDSSNGLPFKISFEGIVFR